MATAVTNHLILKNEGMEIEFYGNADGDIFVQPTNEANAAHFWFTIPKEDWPELKAFIDSQIEASQ